MTESLFCQVGNHWWEREAGQRGRKPISCPDHRGIPLITDVPPTLPEPHVETLQCAAGHAWHRPTTPGKKPLWCEEHRPSKPEPKPKATPPPPPEPEPTQTLWCEGGQHEWTRPRTKGKSPASCPDHRKATQTKPKLTPLATLREQYRIDPESERVLAYIEAQINNPHRVEPFGQLIKAHKGRVNLVRRGGS